MNGASPCGIDIPLPGGAEAVYSAAGLQYLRHAKWQGSAALSTTWARTLASSDYYAPFGFDASGAGAGCRSFTGAEQSIDPSDWVSMRSAAEASGIPPQLLAAVGIRESGFRNVWQSGG